MKISATVPTHTFNPEIEEMPGLEFKNINKPLVQTNRMEGIEEEIKDVAEDGTPRHSFMNSDNSLYTRFKNLNLLSESSH